MKRLIITIFLAVCIYPCFAQNFIDTTKVWSIVSRSSSETRFYITFYYRFMGDSIINGQKYNILKGALDENQINWTFNSLWQERNDSVFKYYSYENTNWLIYDFQMKEGDSLQIFKPYHYLTYFVDSVRVKEWGGRLRKHWYLSNSHSKWTNTVWIEGVGNLVNFTLMTEIGFVGADMNLLCFTENGQQVYQNPDYNSCYVNTVGVSQLEKPQSFIDVYPMGNGSVGLKIQSNGNLSFYTLDGRLVHKTQITQPETTVCLPESGILLYRFITTKGEVQTGKVVVR